MWPLDFLWLQADEAKFLSIPVPSVTRDYSESEFTYFFTSSHQLDFGPRFSVFPPQTLGISL